jgi:hypothetical protein
MKRGPKIILFDINELNSTERVGMRNAVNIYQIPYGGGK